MAEMFDPNSTQGALQQLLSSYNPEERNQAIEQRNQAREQYQAQLNQPIPDAGPIQRIVSDYLTRYASKPNQFAAIAGAAGTEAGRTQQMQLAQRQQGLQAAEYGANRADADVKEAGTFAKNLFNVAKGANGKQPTPEQLKTVYTSARNEAAQIAKGHDFESIEERTAWIENHANSAVQNYISKFASPATINQLPGTPQPQQPQAMAPTPPAFAGISSPVADAASQLPQVPKAPSPTIINKPEEARKKEFAAGMEKGAMKDYEENVKPAASVADSMLNTIGTLRQIPRTQDAFAPYREKLGSAMNALGLDGKMVQEATNLQQVRPLLAKIANDRLLAAKGVQTEGDAQRAYNEFLTISDTQKAADFMYAWQEELANRAKFKKQVYDLSATEKGTMKEGDKYWQQTDYAKTAPVAILNGKPWTYTAWRDAFRKSNPDAGVSDLMGEWNKLAGRK